MQSLMPFIVLLIVAVVFQLIPMEEAFKRIGYIVIGIIALVMLLQFVHLI